MATRILLVLLCCLCVVSAGWSIDREIVVLVTFDGLSLDELAGPSRDAFRPLLDDGAVGVMNNRTASYLCAENNAATISAGTRAAGVTVPAGVSVPLFSVFTPDPPLRKRDFEIGRAGYMPDERIAGETARALFIRRTGETPPPGAIIHTEIAAVRAANAAQRYEVITGMLGEQLGAVDVRVSVFGNADRGPFRVRRGVLIAMNRAGWVPHGDVGAATLLHDPHAPFGVRTDYAYIARRIAALPAGRHFVVVDAGDGARAWNPTYRQAAIARCGAFLVQMNADLTRTTDRYRLLFAGIQPTDEAITRHDLLTPIVMTGTGVRHGLLTSATTKRPGLITNTDLTATVLHAFGIPPHPSVLGQPIRVQPRATVLEPLQEANRRMVTSYQGRFRVCAYYVRIVALVVIWTLLVLIFFNRFAGPFRFLQRPRAIRLALCALMLVPFMLMVAGGLGISQFAAVIAFTAVTSLGAADLLLRTVRDQRILFAIIGLAVAGLLCLDLAIGTPLLQRTMLSYDPIVGIRFYGIGNESSGVLLGALLLGCYALLDLRGRMGGGEIALVMGIYIAAFVLIGGPQFGSDFGGMLSAIPGFGFALLKACPGRLRNTVLLWGGLGAVLLLVLMIVANIFLGGSHIGLAFTHAAQSGPGVLVDLALRKWAMNFRLVRSSAYTLALVTLVIGSAVLLFRPVGIVRRTLRAHPLLNAGFIGIITGLIAAMLTNDSGVAMAATGLLYLVAPLMLLVLGEMERGESGEESHKP